MKASPRLWVGFLLYLPSFCLLAATHTLTLNTNGNGTVAANPTNSVYPHSSVVTVTAAAAPGWGFASWSGNITGTLNPTNVLMDSDKVITANFFQLPTYSLFATASGNGSVSPSNGLYPSNTVVILTATASNGWIFHHWTGGAAGNTNPISVTMNSNKTIVAVFFVPLVITGQPQDVMTFPGGTASFNVSVTGTGPFGYVWRFNGAPLPGANAATLTLTNVQPTNGGNYSVVVSSPYSSVTSAVAVLTACAGTNVVALATDSDLRAAMSIGGNVRLCFSGTIILTNTIAVTKDVALDASGVSVMISGSNAFRLFTVSTGVTFSITNVFLANGRALGINDQPSIAGAAIHSSGGSLHLVSCVVSNHSVFVGDGGAIACFGGVLTVRNCSFFNNAVVAPVSSKTNLCRGGAIYAERAWVEITGSLLQSNSATAASAPLPAQTGNTAEARGGALAVQSGTATVARVRFVANAVVGGFTRQGPYVATVGGGAVYNAGSIFLLNCSFTSNRVQASSGLTAALPGGVGGAIHNTGTVGMDGCTANGNICLGGDGRDPSPGTSANGGAIHSAGVLVVTNSTFTANSVSGGYGASIAGSAFGGAIYGNGGSISLLNVTIADNTAAAPYFRGSAALGANVAVTNCLFALRNSIIAYPGTNANVWGAAVDGGYNMCSDGSANFSSGASFNFTDPKLLPLADNGGPTFTMGLASDSPAIDWIPAGNAPAADQRGFARPYGADADIGAFELGPVVPALVARRSGLSLNVSFAGQAGVRYQIQRSTDMQNWELQQNTGTLATNGIWSATYSASEMMRFYRVRLEL
jgi:hypothetical protein